MKKYYVAFFPEISEDHWVSQFRYQHDEKSHLVAPHITLFFPAEMESSEELLNEANRVAISSPKFSVRFRSVMMMPERGSTGLVSYLFLVPDEGFSNVLRLHDLLYSERFASLLRLDIPFVPHITIGSNLSLSNAKKYMDILNAKQFDLEFIVDRLSIVEINDPSKDRIVTSSVNLK